MIVLQPSVGLARDTKIDYDLLSSILTRAVKIKKRVFFKVIKSNKDYSYYEEIDEEYIIAINLDDGNDLPEVVKGILHELRHHIQECVFKIKTTDFNDSFRRYYASPEEIDARKFEKLSAEVVNIYKNFKKIEVKYKDLKLDSYNEPV